MAVVKEAVKRAFRMEMVGAGLYRSLASQYSAKEPELAACFSRFSQDEYKHGRLFAKLFQKSTGKKLKGRLFWMMGGRMLAFFMRPLSLQSKMKKLRHIETGAVRRIEQDLPLCEDPGLARILKTILPDEKAHAALYGNHFPEG